MLEAVEDALRALLFISKLCLVEGFSEISFVFIVGIAVALCPVFPMVDPR